jgi:DNA-directed RNA polymerase subunit beta
MRFPFFRTTKEILPLPDLNEVQKDSYAWFLAEGLKEVFEDVSPMKDFSGHELELYFLDHLVEAPKCSEEEARARNITYEAPLKVACRLTNGKEKKSVEQEVYLGDLPIMTKRATFIINGVERVVVSQLIRSSGVLFTVDFAQGKRIYGAKIIPNRGAWLEFECDSSGVLWVRIDRKRKVAATSLLKAFGYTNEEIKEKFVSLPEEGQKMLEATFKKDPAANPDEGLIEVYRKIRPGELATVDNAKSLIESMFFRYDRYDLSGVGRYKMNRYFKETLPINKETRVLRREDIVATMTKIISMTITSEEPEDVDHLANRRVRAVGEMLQNRFRVGMARAERIIKDRMSTLDPLTLTPSKIINARPLIAVIQEFFSTSQLSQFMDQTNPLAELEHKRRLSAMGPGGLSRERAGFDVRDVHPTHYGKICPIATPEGPNIGLVNHFASYSRLNTFGFLTTPYRKVVKEQEKTKVTDEIVYCDALEEERSVITPATTPLTSDGYLEGERVPVRRFGKPEESVAQEVQYMDVSPAQIISVATSLVPFLEHDDAIRALMGSNMQRQAVPPINPEAPLVGTGVEGRVALDSGYVVQAQEGGKVVGLDARRIEVQEESGNTKIYPLQKFSRSNASTCINQYVAPKLCFGQQIKKGDILAEGFAVDNGELALGHNLLVAFMPWRGANYEDAIIISERLLHRDCFSSIHIEHYQVDVRETKLGPEVVTSDIPNIGEEKLRNLDEEGVVRIGAEVSSGDILVGKITPKGETELSAEERLLRAIFGEKAKDVRDTSLYLEHGEHGKVVDIKTFSREAGDKLAAGVLKTIQVSVATLRKIQVGDKMAGRHGNKGVISKVVPVENMPYLADGTPVDIILNPLGVISRMNIGQILETLLGLVMKAQGQSCAVPLFYGVGQSQVQEALEKQGFSPTGQMTVYDGQTGTPFDRPVTVGWIYMMKLIHLVEDKIHQRSIGPYSLITQQPLGGRAQFGGQRFGEMEVWALEGYGASSTLQEILTIKSDDVPGRSRAYEAIVKGEKIENVYIPESFNILVRELKGLGLDVELLP